MAVTALNATPNVPAYCDDDYFVGNASGTGLEVNPGDWVIFSGQYIIAAHDGVASFKASGAGIAMDRNPAYDWAGRPVVNSALLVARHPILRVSANFSGQPNLGVHAYPDMTGSAVNAPSGTTGLSTVWQTAAPVSLSGAGATGAPSKAVAQVLQWYGAGNGGTGEMDIAVWHPRADYY